MTSRRFAKTKLAILCILLVGGLASCTKMLFEKPGATEIDFARDESECDHLASVTVGVITGSGSVVTGYVGTSIDPKRFATCMKGRGWRRIDDAGTSIGSGRTGKTFEKIIE